MDNLFTTEIIKDVDENLRARLVLKQAMENDASFASKIWALCKADIHFFINRFVWLHEPREKNSLLPFVTFDFQDEFIENMVQHIETGESLLCVKSRDVGASYCIAAVSLYYFLFHPGSDILLSTYRERYLDKKSVASTLFEKIRYSLYRLPQGIYPEKLKPNQHDNIATLINPNNGNSIVGEVANANLGSSARFRFAVLDEFSKFDTNIAPQAYRSVCDATPCRLVISSVANGKRSYFYKLFTQEAAEIDVVKLHWSQRPDRDWDWYEKQKRERDAHNIATELEMSFEDADIERRAAYRFDRNLHVKPCKIDESLGLVLGCDFNIAKCFFVVSQFEDYKDMPIRRTIDEIVLKYTNTEKMIMEFLKRYQNHPVKKIIVSGDATGQRLTTASTRSDYAIMVKMLEDAGWAVTLKIARKNPPHKERVDVLNKRLQDPNTGDIYEYIDPKCENLIDSLEQVTFKENSIVKDDIYDHGFDAFSMILHLLFRKHLQIKEISTSIY